VSIFFRMAFAAAGWLLGVSVPISRPDIHGAPHVPWAPNDPRGPSRITTAALGRSSRRRLSALPLTATHTATTGQSTKGYPLTAALGLGSVCLAVASGLRRAAVAADEDPHRATHDAVSTAHVSHSPTHSGTRDRHPLIAAVSSAINAFLAELPLEAVPMDGGVDIVTGHDPDGPVQIHNRFLRGAGFRKVHLEFANIGDHMEILHCVFFPDPRTPLPLFGCDVVVARGRVSAAIVDLSPMSDSSTSTSTLPSHPRTPYANRRSLPAWGTGILSPEVCFVQPTTPQEEEWFVDDVLHRLRILRGLMASASPRQWDDPGTVVRWRRQRAYCLHQRQNRKTRAVLVRAFGDEWAEDYVSRVLFDCPPDPPSQYRPLYGDPTLLTDLSSPLPI